MSTWSVLPEAGPPEAILFSSARGSVTRADVQRSCHERLQRLGAVDGDLLVPHEAEPAAFLVELLAAWSAGCALVLEPKGRRLRPGVGSLSHPEEADARAFDAPLDPDQVLLDLYTSGTTGQPERHTKTARQLLGEAQVLGPLARLDSGSVVLSTVPLHHLYGLLFGLLAPARAGARIVSDSAGDPNRFHPHRVAEAIREHGVTHLVTIPAHIQSLLDAAAPLRGLREVVSSAAALPIEWAERLERLSGARVIDVLGSTESGGIAFRRSAKESSYHPLPGVTVRASPGGYAEILSSFADPDHALSTGDRIDLQKDGTFLHLGRQDGVIKVGGKRFSLVDLVSAALGVPGVTDAMAFARPLARARGTEVALVVASETLDRGAVRSGLTGRVDPLLMPRRLCVLRRLPRDARGKLPEAALQRYVLLPGFDLLDIALSPFRLEVRLRGDSKRLDGHFPGAPVLPGVAQLLDLVVPEVERMAGAPVVSARRLKWQAPVRPGDVLVLSIEPAEPGNYRFRLAAREGTSFSSGLFETLTTRR